LIKYQTARVVRRRPAALGAEDGREAVLSCQGARTIEGWQERVATAERHGRPRPVDPQNGTARALRDQAQQRGGERKLEGRLAV
jgi:hypothetical protein